MTHLEDVAERLSQHDEALARLTDEVKALREKLGEDRPVLRDLRDLADRVDTLQTAVTPVSGSGAGAGGGGSPAAGGASAAQAIAGAAAVPTAPSSDAEEQAGVRARVHDLAVASGHLVDIGNTPQRFLLPRFPSAARKGEQVAIENVPWAEIEWIKVNGIPATNVTPSDNGIDFTIPSKVSKGQVAEVLVEVKNVGVFRFPLMINPRRVL